MRPAIAPISVLLSGVLAATAVHAQTTPGHRYMWGDWGWGHMIFGSLMMVLFWGGIIVVAVVLFRWLRRGSTAATAPPGTETTAINILQERFARGEIDKEEFEERRRVLGE